MVILVVLLAAVAGIVIKDIYDSTDHSSYEDINQLRDDARPVDLKRNVVGTRGHRRWRTTVIFNDGFKFISHKTDVNDRFLSYSISVSSPTNNEIISEALSAHAKAIAKRRPGSV